MLRLSGDTTYRHDVFCKGSEKGALAECAEELGSKVMVSPLRPTHLSFVKSLGSVLRSGEYNLVHNHLETYSGIGVMVAKRHNVPVITSYHNTQFPAQTWIRALGLRQVRGLYSRISIGYALKRSTFVTGCSRGVLDAVDPLRRVGTRARVLYYGVETAPRLEAGERASWRDAMGWDAAAPVVLHVGRFFGQKNHRGVIQVFIRLLALNSSARLVLVGDGPLRADIERQVLATGLTDHVKFLGERRDVRRLMALSDCFLLPSHFEGFAVVALEAAATSLPVVAAHIPGLTEAIVDGETGRLLPPRDYGAMAIAVDEVLTDSTFRERIVQRARERINGAFSVESSHASLIQLYDECLGYRERSVCDYARPSPMDS
jgi:glycosyltransferase EpsF